MFRSLIRGMGRGVVPVLLVLLAVPSPARAQETDASLQLLTPYAGVAVEPGDTATFPLVIAGPSGTRVGLSVAEEPDGWSASVRGGGYVVDEVIIDDAHMPDVSLEVKVPTDMTEGIYRVVLSGESTAGAASLDIDVRVQEAVSGTVTLDTDFPRLQGPADATFTFNLNLDNETPTDIQFALDAQGPAGWTIGVKPSGESRATTMTVAAGGTGRIGVDAKPSATVVAGTYPLEVTAIGTDVTAAIDLSVEVTGTYGATLSTLDQRLNADVEAGSTTDVQLVLANSGSAPLENVSLTASAPSGWDVTFEPADIAMVPAGQSTPVVAHMTPSTDAVAGDYVVTIRSTVPEVVATLDLRASVHTSALWGVVGVGVILAALLGLGLVFRRFGRR